MAKLRISDYSWVIKGLTSVILLSAFVYMLINYFSEDQMGVSVITPIIGIAILLFTVVRIIPVLASRKEKDYLLVMYSEILVSLVIGVIFLVSQDFANKHFSILLGVILYIRGCVHFFTTSKQYELSDVISYFVNILFISFGFIFIFAWSFTAEDLMKVLIGLALLLSLYFAYGTYTGFSNSHLNRQNRLKMKGILNKKGKEQEVIDDPKHIEEKRNPKIIDEPNQPQINPTDNEDEKRDSDIIS